MSRTRRKSYLAASPISSVNAGAAPKAATDPATTEICVLRLTCGAGTKACIEKSTTPTAAQEVTTDDLFGMFAPMKLA